jgi:hypothetical protein
VEAVVKAAIGKFRGLDVRRLREASDPRTARVARNVDLTVGGEFEARDGFEPLMPLNAQSRGLYSMGGTLRCIAPGGQGIPLDAVGPVRVKYDHLGSESSSYTSVMVAMTNTSTVTLLGAAWPTGSTGATLTVDGDTFTIGTVTGQDAAINAPFTGIPGLYTFTLTGSATLSSRTVSITTGTDRAILTNGTWPALDPSTTLTISSAQFSSRVVARVSATELQLAEVLLSPTLTDRDFLLSNVAEDYPLDTLTKITAVESVGASASFGVYPYLCVERWLDASNRALGVVYEHHWIRSDPVDGNSPVLTKVTLPFSPGSSMVQASGKVWADDDVNGVVRYCSTLAGPYDWITPEDAGYIPVITHTSGDRRIRALGIYDSKLAVIFSDAVQLWATDPQPTNITLVRVLDGPGTSYQRSVANVLGDLFYLTRGGFRSLHTAEVSGQVREQDDIGTPIDDLVRDLRGQEVTAAIWSQKRGQYLCAVGPTIYAFRYNPQSKIMGWTTWDFGEDVEAMVEQDGVLYLRSNNVLYRMNADYRDGDVYEVTLNDFTGKDPSTRKRLDFIEVLQRGETTVRAYTEAENDAFYTEGPTITGSTVGMEKVFIGALGRTIGLRFVGSAPWTLSALHLTYTDLNG